MFSINRRDVRRRGGSKKALAEKKKQAA